MLLCLYPVCLLAETHTARMVLDHDKVVGLNLFLSHFKSHIVPYCTRMSLCGVCTFYIYILHTCTCTFTYFITSLIYRFAFVEFASPDSVPIALQYNGAMFGDRPVK